MVGLLASINLIEFSRVTASAELGDACIPSNLRINSNTLSHNVLLLSTCILSNRPLNSSEEIASSTNSCMLPVNNP